MGTVNLLSKEPEYVTLESGTFSFCSCGKSTKLPFCDGSHHGRKFIMVHFKIAEKREAWLCNFQQPKNAVLENQTHKDQNQLLGAQK